MLSPIDFINRDPMQTEGMNLHDRCISVQLCNLSCLFEGNAGLAFGIAFSLILSSKARDTCGQSRRRSSFHRTLCLTLCVKHHEISRAISCMSCCSVGSCCSSNKALPSFAVLGVFVGSCNIIFRQCIWISKVTLSLHDTGRFSFRSRRFGGLPRCATFTGTHRSIENHRIAGDMIHVLKGGSCSFQVHCRNVTTWETQNSQGWDDITTIIASYIYIYTLFFLIYNNIIDLIGISYRYQSYQITWHTNHMNYIDLSHCLTVMVPENGAVPTAKSKDGFTVSPHFQMWHVGQARQGFCSQEEIGVFQRTIGNCW